ncbi:response regulator transcription factor [Shouchella shacheensis]|uniref:response regulator transcription factor n=1 Tax=Shouchella shacheensis TaxID=1649580 RepID=UPI0007403A2E|nr:response regulator transcription factor [Shouchella shacheensis]
MTCILLVEDQHLVRQGLKMMIEQHEGFRVVEAENGAEAIERYEAHFIDVVLMDIRMPVMTGLEAAKRIRSSHLDSRIIMLTTFADDEYALEALKLGALGYLLKDADGERLLAAIKGALKNELTLDGQVAANVVPKLVTKTKQNEQKPRANLTEREVAITALVGEGLSNQEISETLHLSNGTVKNYISQLLTKLALRDRTQLAIYALKHDLA